MTYGVQMVVFSYRIKSGLIFQTLVSGMIILGMPMHTLSI